MTLHGPGAVVTSSLQLSGHWATCYCCVQRYGQTCKILISDIFICAMSLLRMIGRRVILLCVVGRSGTLLWVMGPSITLLNEIGRSITLLRVTGPSFNWLHEIGRSFTLLRVVGRSVISVKCVWA